MASAQARQHGDSTHGWFNLSPVTASEAVRVVVFPKPRLEIPCAEGRDSPSISTGVFLK